MEDEKEYVSKRKDDRDEDDDEEEKSESSGRESVQSSGSASPTDKYNFEDVDFAKFSAFMGAKFGLRVFQTGYEIM